MSAFVLRFLIGGTVVSLFSFLGDVLRPKSFAGLFAAAPSIALATLSLAFANSANSFIALEGRSMILGATGLIVYCRLVSDLLVRLRRPTFVIVLPCILAWMATSFGFWWLLLHGRSS